jgi:hypothetical protein
MFQVKLLCYGFDYIHWYLHLKKKNPICFLFNKKCLSNQCLYCNTMRACHNLNTHILALDGDNEVFNMCLNLFMNMMSFRKMMFLCTTLILIPLSRNKQKSFWIVNKFSFLAILDLSLST